MQSTYSKKSLFSSTEDIYISDDNKNIKLNLGMCKNESELKTAVFGKVVNPTGYPIRNAIVKILDNDNNSVGMAKTDKGGNYFIQGFPYDELLKIFVVIHNKTVSDIISFEISEEGYTCINLTVNKQAPPNQSIIVGDLICSSDNIPINSAAISLFRRSLRNKITLDSLVYTNEFGQFSLRDLEVGKYQLKFNANGYNPKTYPILIRKRGQISDLEIKLLPDTCNQIGTVSGIIMDDQTNIPVQGADVILFKSAKDSTTGREKLIPIAFTKTNESGVYMFNNVDTGRYKIRSSKIDYNDMY
ncbi:MAG: carboxypeptidase-like regulatory domain-containing protein [Clostridium sp.]